MSEVEVIAGVEQRRRWTRDESAAPLAKVKRRAARFRGDTAAPDVGERVYDRCSAKKAVPDAEGGSPEPIAFVCRWVIGEAVNERRVMVPPLDGPRPAHRAAEGRAGAIETTLADGSRVCADSPANEKALLRIIRAVSGSR